MAHYVMITKEYPPDTSAVWQYFESAAIRLARRGHQVTVYTADRDNDNPSIKYDNFSRHPDVRVVRLAWTSFGKRTIAHRLVGQSVYLFQVFFRLLLKRDVDALVISTCPPTIGFMCLKLRLFRHFPMLYWVLDLNPDQAVATGTFAEDSLPVRLLEWANGHLYRSADHIVVLDRYMRMRILRKNCLNDDDCGKVEIIPLWPLEQHIKPVARSENTFITTHRLEDKKCVFMYSGNHSLVHPLGTLLAALRHKKKRDDLAFLFVGGGQGKGAVEAFIGEGKPGNVQSLPYQPLERLGFSLSAADVHIVVMGERMVGIVHPCKIYGAMVLGKPVLFIGPRQSHLGELVSLCGFGWVVEHGDADRLEQLIDEIAALTPEQREAIGARGREVLEKSYSADTLAGRFCELVEGLKG